MNMSEPIYDDDDDDDDDETECVIIAVIIIPLGIVIMVKMWSML